MLADSATGEAAIWGSQTAVCSDLAGVSFLRALVTFTKTLPSCSNPIPKAPSPSPVTPGVRVQHRNSGGTQTLHLWYLHPERRSSSFLMGAGKRNERLGLAQNMQRLKRPEASEKVGHKEGDRSCRCGCSARIWGL